MEERSRVQTRRENPSSAPRAASGGRAPAKAPAPGNGRKKAPKKDPLWERIVVAVLLFFIELAERTAKSVVNTARFWIGVFAGIAGLIAGIIKGRKKDKAAKRRQKQEQARRREIENAEKARKREAENAEKAKKREALNAEEERRRKLGKAEKARRKDEKRRAKLREKAEKREEKRKAKEEKKAEKKRRRRFLATKTPALLLAIVLFFELAVIASAGGLYLWQSLRSGGSELTMNLVIDRDRSVATTVPKEAANVPGGTQPCFDLTFFAKELGFLAFGDAGGMIYTLPNGQTLRVADGSNTVYVDGMPVSLSSVVRFKSDRVYAPAELLQRCVGGVGVNYDKANSTLTLICAVKPDAISLLPEALETVGDPSFV